MNRYFSQFRDEGKDYFKTDSAWETLPEAIAHNLTILTCLFPRVDAGQVFDHDLQRVVYPKQGRVLVTNILHGLTILIQDHNSILLSNGIRPAGLYSMYVQADVSLLELIRATLDYPQYHRRLNVCYSPITGLRLYATFGTDENEDMLTLAASMD